jgi:hypothetical protein
VFTWLIFDGGVRGTTGTPPRLTGALAFAESWNPCAGWHIS